MGRRASAQSGIPGQLILIVNGHAQHAVVSVIPQGLCRTVVTPGTGSASASYDVDAAFMHMDGLLQNRKTVSHAEISAWQVSVGDELNRFYLPKLRESEGAPEWRLAI